jgi:hypothetical protein
VLTALKPKYWRNGRRNLQCFPACKVFGDYSSIRLEDLKQHDFMWGKCRGQVLAEVTLQSNLHFEDVILLARVHSLENIPVPFEEAVIRECMIGRPIESKEMETMKEQWILGERLIPENNTHFHLSPRNVATFEFKPKVWKYTDDMISQGKCKRRNVRYYVQFEAFVQVFSGERQCFVCVGSGMSTSFEVGSSRVLARQKKKQAITCNSNNNTSGVEASGNNKNNSNNGDVVVMVGTGTGQQEEEMTSSSSSSLDSLADVSNSISLVNNQHHHNHIGHNEMSMASLYHSMMPHAPPGSSTVISTQSGIMHGGYSSYPSPPSMFTQNHEQSFIPSGQHPPSSSSSSSSSSSHHSELQQQQQQHIGFHSIHPSPPTPLQDRSNMILPIGIQSSSNVSGIGGGFVGEKRKMSAEDPVYEEENDPRITKMIKPIVNSNLIHHDGHHHHHHHSLSLSAIQM